MRFNHYDGAHIRTRGGWGRVLGGRAERTRVVELTTHHALGEVEAFPHDHELHGLEEDLC